MTSDPLLSSPVMGEFLLKLFNDFEQIKNGVYSSSTIINFSSTHRIHFRMIVMVKIGLAFSDNLMSFV